MKKSEFIYNFILKSGDIAIDKCSNINHNHFLIFYAHFYHIFKCPIRKKSLKTKPFRTKLRILLTELYLVPTWM